MSDNTFQDPYPAPQMAPTPPPTNTVGMIGFILSLCGILFACLFPIGMIVSMCGLGKQPKGFAIAGSVIGAVGTLLIVLVFILYGAMIAACVGIASTMQPVIETQAAIREAQSQISDYEDENGELPDEGLGNELISDKKDGWEQQLQYELSDDAVDGYVIRSAGADGEFHTDDDTTSDDFSYDANFDYEYEDFDMEDEPADNFDDEPVIDIDGASEFDMEDGSEFGVDDEPAFDADEESGLDSDVEADDRKDADDERDPLEDLFGTPAEPTGVSVTDNGG